MPDRVQDVDVDRDVSAMFARYGELTPGAYRIYSAAGRGEESTVN